MGSRPSAHSLGSVLRLFVCLSGACLVSCWASTAAHRASRCFGSMQSRQPSTSLSCPSPGHPSFCHRITRLGFPSGPDEVETPDSPSLQTPDSWERTPPAQRRNAHRPLHQCMINLPISSLRFHPPSPSPRTAGSGPGLVLVLVLVLFSRLLCTVSPRLESGGWKFLVIQPPPGAIQAPPGEP